jgi:hypothetical protein
MGASGHISGGISPQFANDRGLHLVSSRDVCETVPVVEQVGALREDRVWLLQSRINPFGLAGSLTLDDGRLRFILDETAAGDPLTWLERQLGEDDLAGRIEAGEEIVAFDLELSGCEVSWPVTGGGATMLVKALDRTWVISYDVPTAKKLSSAVWVLSGRRKARAWKAALAAAGL